MADTEDREEASRQGEAAALLVGAGKRPRELGAVLGALATLRTQGSGARAPYAGSSFTMTVSDLEELLAKKPPEGTLILDYERVPGEDIGFVRRFLERHVEWRLVVLGEDVKDRRARGLLGLPRAQWLPWPPDLDQVSALLPSSNGSPRATGESRKDAAPAAPTTSKSAAGTDLGALVEDLVTAESLGDDTPRYDFELEAPTRVQRSADEVQLVLGELEGLLAVARHAAGKDGEVVVGVAPGQAAGSGRIQFEFRAGKLPDEIAAGLLDESLDPPRGVTRLVRDARAAAQRLGELGARVAASTGTGGMLRLEVLIEAASGSVEPGAPGKPREAKPEDPFA